MRPTAALLLSSDLLNNVSDANSLMRSVLVHLLTSKEIAEKKLVGKWHFRARRVGAEIAISDRHSVPHHKLTFSRTLIAAGRPGACE